MTRDNAENQGSVKRQSHPEIYILLMMGVEPATLIAKGYSKATVYKYHKEIPKIRRKIENMLTNLR